MHIVCLYVYIYVESGPLIYSCHVNINIIGFGAIFRSVLSLEDFFSRFIKFKFCDNYIWGGNSNMNLLSVGFISSNSF